MASRLDAEERLARDCSGWSAATRTSSATRGGLVTDDAEGVLPTWWLGAFDDVEATLRHSLARLRSSRELTARDRVRGFIFDPETGALREVETPGGRDRFGRARA